MKNKYVKLLVVSLVFVVVEAHAGTSVEAYCESLQKSSPQSYATSVKNGLCDKQKRQEQKEQRDAADLPWKNKLFDIPKGTVICSKPTFIQEIKSGDRSSARELLNLRIKQGVCALASDNKKNWSFKHTYHLPIEGRQVEIFALGNNSSDYEFIVDSRDVNMHD